MTNNKLEADPKKEFCSNPNCRDYGKRGEGNIVRYGHDKNGRQRFKFLIRYVGLTKVQVDEMWSFVKKQKNVDGGDGDDDGQGDCWIYIAKKTDTKLHLAHSTGKRVQATADKLMKTVRKRGKIPTKDEKATFASDGNFR